MDMADEAGLCLTNSLIRNGSGAYMRLLNEPPSEGIKSGTTRDQQQGLSAHWSAHTVGSHAAASDGGDSCTSSNGQASRFGQETAGRSVCRVRPFAKEPDEEKHAGTCVHIFASILQIEG